jgi:polysaccharide export outer membrane protein
VIPESVQWRTRTFLPIVAALSLVACSGVGKYVWVDDLAETNATGATSGYILSPGDLISVRVYNQEGMSNRGRIRTDGKISLPFLNDIQAAGYTPGALAQQLQTRLKEFVNLPVVTVSVEEAKPVSVSVLGQVPKQGSYQIEPGTRLAQVLALAGGLNDFAHKDRIFVVRNSSAPQRIRFTYEAISRAEGRAAMFALQPGDVVVIE